MTDDRIHPEPRSLHDYASDIRDARDGDGLPSGLLPSNEDERFIAMLFSDAGPGNAGVPARTYDEWSAGRSVDQRRDLMQAVAFALHSVPADLPVLAPFLLAEVDIDVIAEAAGWFARIAPLTRGDAFSGPHAVIYLALQVAPLEPERSASILLGIVRLGDRRIVQLLDRSWRAISPEGRVLLAGCLPATPTLAAIETALRWLEDEEAPQRSLPAAAMARLGRDAQTGFLDRTIPFPAAGFPLDVFAPPKAFSRGEVVEAIAPRLHGLNAGDPSGLLIPALLEAWGISQP